MAAVALAQGCSAAACQHVARACRRQRRRPKAVCRSTSTAVPPMPASATGPNTGSRRTPTINSPRPRTMRATSTPSKRGGRPLASRQRANAARTCAKAARTPSASATPSTTPPTSLLCSTSREHSLTATGSRSARRWPRPRPHRRPARARRPAPRRRQQAQRLELGQCRGVVRQRRQCRQRGGLRHRAVPARLERLERGGARQRHHRLDGMRGLAEHQAAARFQPRALVVVDQPAQQQRRAATRLQRCHALLQSAPQARRVEASGRRPPRSRRPGCPRRPRARPAARPAAP